MALKKNLSISEKLDELKLGFQTYTATKKNKPKTSSAQASTPLKSKFSTQENQPQLNEDSLSQAPQDSTRTEKLTSMEDFLNEPGENSFQKIASDIQDDIINEIRKEKTQENQKMKASQEKTKKPKKEKSKLSKKELSIFQVEKKQHSLDSQEILNQPFVLNLSNNLKIAEKRMRELESENDQLRISNEKLTLAGEALQESFDKLSSEHKLLKSDYEHERSGFVEQKRILENAATAQTAEVKALKLKNSTLENRLNRDVKKIRVREKELENRLELKQSEMESLMREKDKTLLQLKRESDSLREKIQTKKESFQKLEKKQDEERERSRRVIRALQMSLHLLKGGEDYSVYKEESSELQNTEGSKIQTAASDK